MNGSLVVEMVLDSNDAHGCPERAGIRERCSDIASWICWCCLVCALFLGLSGQAQAQQWEQVGRTPQSTVTPVSATSLVFSPDGTPYIAYKHGAGANLNRAGVKRLNAAGTGWESVGGAAVSPGSVSTVSLAFAPDGTPYVAYEDRLNGSRANVKRLNAAGTAWVQVGDTGPAWKPGFSAGEADSVSLVFSAEGSAYVSYQDRANGYKATVMRLNAGGTEWKVVGAAGFSAGRVENISLAVGAGNRPYVAYQDETRGYKATVMRLNTGGTAWESAGPAGFTPDAAAHLFLAVSPGGQPYVAYSSQANGDAASVLRLNAEGTGWESAGYGSVSSGLTMGATLAFAPDGKLYVAYRAQIDGFKATVRSTDAAASKTFWTTVGSAGFSMGSALDLSVAVHPDGTPYVVYVDEARAAKSTVMRLSAAGPAWEAVGEAEFSMGAAAYTSLAFGPNGKPYVAYADQSNGGKATVIGLNAAGTDWEPAGAAGFSMGSASYISLAFGTDGKPYVAYRDAAHDGKATVMRLNAEDSAWEAVGPAGFSAGAASYTSLVFDPNGRLFVGYQDGAHEKKVTVMGLNAAGTAWEALGIEGFSAGEAAYVSLAVGPDGEPYVGFQDKANSSRATVMRLNTANSAWELVGKAGFSSVQARFTSLAVSPDGRPYLAYQGGSNNNVDPAVVMGLNAQGTAWEAVGTGDSFWPAQQISLAIGPDGKPYAAYAIPVGGKVMVMHLDAAERWRDMGAGVSQAEAAYPSLVFGPDGKPYVAFRNSSKGGIPTVMRWTQTMISRPGAATNVLAVAGNSYATVSFDVPASTGGSGVTIERYTVTSSPGNIPCRVTINPDSTQQSCKATGLQNGTPYTFGVTAFNVAGGGSVARSNTVTPQALSLSAPEIVPPATFGQAYELRLSASGGAGNYVYSLNPDSLPLPAGLDLDGATGLISGTPTAPAGTYPVSVDATDSDGETVTLDLTITIAGKPAVSNPVTPVPTLNQWGVMLLGLVAVGLGMRRLRLSGPTDRSTHTPP